MDSFKNKNTLIWAVVGVVVAVVVIYFLVSGGVVSPQGPVQGEQTSQGTVVAPGSSAVATSGLVVTPEGKPVNNAAEPGTPDAPKQSNPISVSDIPSQAIKITMASSGITPSSFTVSAGQVVQLSIAEGDTQTHIFKFDDPSLAAVAVGIGPGDSVRVITFNAPSKAGSYTFFCDVPGHRGRGEQGTMIVK